MAFFTLHELLDIIIMIAAIGFIFKDMFRKPLDPNEDPYEAFKRHKQFINWDDLKFAVIVIAPAILLHELGHKFVAMGFGLSATFYAAYLWLALGVVLKLMGVGLIFFVPAYVAHSAAALPWQSSLIAFAGPFVNLLLWFGSWYILRSVKHLTKTQRIALAVTKKVNLFLFIFNMIPIPPFDGGHVVLGLWHTFF
jgi:Zn-dependent protease